MDKDQEVFLEFLRLVSCSGDTREFIETATSFFYRHSGCDAVGIRLRDGEDFPYCETRGFSPDFLKYERSLCARTPQGCPLRDTQGKAVLQCLCGALVTGLCAIAQKHLTPLGTFYANDLSAFASHLSTAEREKHHIRGRCATEGFQSVALFPLIGKTGRMGLLQLNARKKGHFTPEFLELWERLVSTFSVALQKFQDEEALQQEHARLDAKIKRLKEEIFRISEREQRHLAQELHDGICQHLTGTSLACKVLFNKLAKQQDPAAQDMARICSLLTIAVDETRHLSHGLYPVRSEEGGIELALARLAKNTSALFPVYCQFRRSGVVQIANEAAATHLYRIAQEAVHNAIKHGEAERVHIRLQTKRNAILLTVEDNGCGIPDKLPAAHGIGLQIMAHRAAELGGALEVHRGRRRGTVLTCSFPAVEL